jgi:hypothetical protein
VSTLAAGRQCQPVYESFIDKVSTLAAPVRGDVEGSDGWNVEGQTLISLVRRREHKHRSLGDRGPGRCRRFH